MSPLEITRRQLVDLYNAHKRLDGTKDTPYKFNMQTRYNLARNLGFLNSEFQAVHTAQREKLKELTPDSGRIEPGTKEYYEVETELSKFLDETVKIEKIHRIALKDLQLDLNAIPVTVLCDLGPIIVEDVT